MRKLILVFAAIAITAGAYAQADSAGRKMNPTDTHSRDSIYQNQDMHINQNKNLDNKGDRSHSDGIVMQNGKIMKVQNGKLTVLDNDVTMSNGTKIMSDGSFTKKDGTKSTLKEGQHIDMSGKMTTKKTDKDKNMYLVPDSTKRNY